MITNQNAPEGPGPILTKQDLARRWKVSTDTIDKLARDRVHGVRSFRVGRQVRFRLCDVEAYEQKNLTRMRPF
jgi:excisionase family DNA binding protein